MFNQEGGHHPLVLLLSAVFIVGLIYFIFIRNPNFLNKFLGGKVGAAAGDTATGWNVYAPTGQHSLTRHLMVDLEETHMPKTNL